MTKSHQDTDLITALQNELAAVKAELVGLQGGRSVRIAKFTRQLVSSKPKEAVKILKTAPELIKRYDPPAPEDFLSSKGKFSSAHSSLPLLKYPNINVAVLGSVPSDIFGNTCNGFQLGSPAYRDLKKYEAAIQLVVIEASKYMPEKHKAMIGSVLADGGKLLVLHKNEPEYADLKHTFSDNAYFVDTNTIESFVEIYDIDISLPGPKTHKKPHFFGAQNTYSSAEVICVTSDDIKKANRDKKYRLKIISLIASGQAVVVQGEKPAWIADEIKTYQNTDELGSLLESLSLPYVAEQYAIRCSRSTILNNNALRVTEDLLSQVGILSKQQNSKNADIGVILSTRRPQNIEKILPQIEKQTIKPSQVALLLHGATDDEYEEAVKIASQSSLNIDIERVDGATLFGEVLNTGLDMIHTDLVTKMDDDDYYGPNHLLDLYVARLHSCADFVGKWNNWVYLEAEDKTINWVPEYRNSTVRHLPGGTFLVKTSTLKQLRFGLVRRAIDSELFRRAEKRGATLYSTHRYNYIRKRGDDHTYRTANSDFKSRASSIIVEGLPLEDTLFA